MGSTMKIDKNKLTSNKPGVDDYFKSMFGANQNDIHYIELYKLIPFEGQPFKPYSDEKLQELADDIAEHGILSPLIVRPYGDTYQIMAGHNRANAAALAGLDTAPCIVKSVDDDTAKIIMLNTNLNQRDELLPSEKAFAYKMQMDTIKHQGQRTDLTSSPMEPRCSSTLAPLGPKLRSDQVVADRTGDSRANVQRYIRLTYLLPALLDMVDNKQIPFCAGVSLSYLKDEDQRLLLSFMNEHKLGSVSLDQADKIKSLEEVSRELLSEIFGFTSEEKIKSEKQSAKTVNLKIPIALFGDNDVAKIKADEELYRRIADTINQYYREKNT